ncbi:hypothetical protein [Planococcus sp. ISL-109]|uniref:hypothetical protein n=1 Tax=Planococcus sp. ISL-109 TaxID=2819166 RepID=UPI001BE6D286|nr:hypothetical protein [Planococcus sp. ISL-109]MBT2583114.1 hypothetical protein [Planococcus sp. ISL-109]
MGKYQSAEVQDTFNWEMRGYEEYIAGYKLYKRLNRKWDAIEREETSDDTQQILG